MISKSDIQKVLSGVMVTDDAEILKGYASDNSYVTPKKPALAISPTSAGQVIKLVELAREKKLKLVPVSSGAPHFRGDTIPAVDDAVIVDLSKMNQIEWINRRNRVACVYPGVTFDQLEIELEKLGMRSMIPLAPRKNKSVVAAYMEREPFTVPRYAWDLTDPIASSELILGDGTLLRTGGAAGPGYTLEDQRKVDGAHKLPMNTNWIDPKRIAQGSQGSFAICTWVALRCELLPKIEKVFFAGSDDVDKLIEASKRFLYLRITDENYLLNALSFACLVEKEPSRIAELQKKLPAWILVSSLGAASELPEDEFAYKSGDFREEADTLGIKLLEEIGGVTEVEYREKVLRKSSGNSYWKTRYKGDSREIFFLSSMSRAPEFIKAAHEVAQANGFNPADLGIYLQLVIQGSACHNEFNLNVAPDAAPAMEKFFNELSKKIYSMGGYYSRPYGMWSDLVYPDSKVFVKYARGLKKIFDPNIVMNPGKLCFKEM